MMTLGLSLFIISLFLMVGGAASGYYGLYSWLAGGSATLFTLGAVALLVGAVIFLTIWANGMLDRHTIGLDSSSHTYA